MMKRRRWHQKNSELQNEDNKDMLSNLPDCILLHILSFLNAKYAVQTCLLSTRWKHLWRYLPTLNLSSSLFRNLDSFSKFVSLILSFRDSSTPLNAIDFERRGRVDRYVLIRIVRYAASHNVHRLRIFCASCKINHRPFPPFFSCQSLTSLELGYQKVVVMFPNTLNLPALTYLKLHNLSFCSGNDGRAEPFSTFNKLNTLILLKCRVMNAQKQYLEEPLCISSTTLLNLSIHTAYTVSGCHSNIELFTPSLCTFGLTLNSFTKLSGSNLSSIKEVGLSLVVDEAMYPMKTTVGMDLLNWLIEMTDIESLTVCPNTLKALSLVPDLLELSLPSLCNLRSLQLNVSSNAYGLSQSSWRETKMELASGKSWKENAKLREAIKAGLMPKYSSIIDGMIDFLLQNSFSAKVDVIEYPLENIGIKAGAKTED